MIRWSRGLALIPVLGLLALIVACEESTSGADVVAVLRDAGVDATTDAGASTVDGGGTDGGGTSVPACVACAATQCATELEACGDACLGALACAEACDTALCRERCLRGASSTLATDFKHCYFQSCIDPCPDVKALLTGIGAYAKIHCAAFQLCAPGALPFRYGDQAGCEQQFKAYFYLSAMLPGSGVSLTTLEACAAQETAMTCADFNSSRIGLACQIQGTKAIDEPCEEDSQCESSFCPGPDRACAKCRPIPGYGDPCEQGRCGSGLVCGASNTCVGSSAIGAPCDATSICELGNCVAGTCQAPGGLGATCDASLGCDFARGLTCSAGKCVQFTAGKPGDSCAPVAGQIRTCQGRAGCSGGACKAPPKIDEACDDTNGPYCTWPNTCRDGKCAGFVFPYPCE